MYPATRGSSRASDLEKSFSREVRLLNNLRGRELEWSGFLLRLPLPALTSNLLTKGNFCHSQIFRPSYQACIGSCPSLLEPVDLRGDTILCHSITSPAVFGSVHVVSPADAHFVSSSTHPASSPYLIQCTALPIFNAVSLSHLQFIWRMLDFLVFGPHRSCLQCASW